MNDTPQPEPEKPDAPVTDAEAARGTTTTDTTTEAPEVDPHDARGDRTRSVLREIASGDVLAGVLAVFLAVFVGSVMIAATDDAVREAAG